MKPNGDFIGAGRHRKLGTYDAAMCGDRSCEARSCVCYLWTKSEMHWYNAKGTLDIPKEIYLKQYERYFLEFYFAGKTC